MKKILSYGVLILLASFVLVPYMIPLSKATDVTLPYDNSQHFVSDKTTLHYRLYEPAAGPVLGKIVLLHGLGGSTYSYQKNAPFLAPEGFLVISVDLPGFGYSSRNTDENHSQLHRAQLVWELVDEVDLNLDPQAANLPWHLGGHSMGGGTVAAMAFQNPAATASIILIDGALFETSRGGNIASLPVISRWLQVILEYVLIKPQRIEDFLESAYGQMPKQEDIRGYYEPLAIPGTARSASALLKSAKNMPAANLEQVTMPVLAIWGEQDTWVPVTEINRILSLMPQTVVKIVQGATHCPMETHPEIFNEYVHDWLKNQQ